MQQQRGTWNEAVFIVVAIVAVVGIGHRIYQSLAPSISCSSDVLDTPESMTKQECRALVAIYDANVQIEYPASRPESKGFVPRPLRDWKVEPNPCLWNAVVCQGGHITELSIVGDTADFLAAPRLPPQIGELTTLRRLNIDSFGIENWPSELASLTNLKTLSFRGDIHSGANQVAEVVEQLTNLEELSLIIEGTSSFPDGLLASVRKLPHLTRLALATSGDFPLELLEMTELTSLQLLGPGAAARSNDEADGFSELPSAIGRMTKLTDLSLSGQSLSALPPQIADLRLLTSLDLSRNDFATVPDGLSALPKLRSVNLARNHLTEIPSWVGELKRLETLEVGFNELDAVPTEIGEMASLSSLGLGGNEFSTVPEAVFELNPARLDLSENRFSEFPLQPGQLSNVAELNLGGNSLSEFPMDLAALPNLSKLNLSSNGITDLPAEVGDLTYLSHLDLHSNYDLYNVDALIPFVQQPGYEQRLDLESTCAYSTEPRLQRFIDETRDWGLCGHLDQQSG